MSEGGCGKTSSIAYVWDYDNKKYVPQEKSSQAESGGIKSSFITDQEGSELLNEILKQLKIMNLHLSIMTDNVITKQEVG